MVGGGVVGMIRGFGVEDGTGVNCGVDGTMFVGCSVDTRVGGRVGCSWDGMVPLGGFGTTNGKVGAGVGGVVCGVAVGEVVWGGTVGEVVAGVAAGGKALQAGAGLVKRTAAKVATASRMAEEGGHAIDALRHGQVAETYRASKRTVAEGKSLRKQIERK